MKNQYSISPAPFFSTAPGLISSLHNEFMQFDHPGRESRFADRKKIDNFFMFLLKNAIREQINRYGEWQVISDTGPGKFAEEIAGRYSIQSKTLYVRGSSGKRQIEFRLLGKVAAILENYSMYDAFTVVSDIRSLSGDADIGNLALVPIDIWHSENIYSKQTFSEIYQQLTDSISNI